ncbi:DUF3958 family protein [Breznakia pachnodae]|uniref:Uncharacterized protein n=1 Tax=Breznakia pachnodae TaxID=265178 RepID=A0ABU0E6J0_9FIRM|nr:DUF3958 family protein [Breznakia pachnodae]MDQ0362518.1 hypothetical protein [Breznakia pachnodae]
MNEEYRGKLQFIQDESDIVINKMKKLGVHKEELNELYQDQRRFLDDLLSNDNSDEFNRDIEMLNSDIITMQNQSMQKLEETQDELQYEKKKLDLKEEDLFEQLKNIEVKDEDTYVD